MGKDLKGKELGKGIGQQKNGLYTGRFVDKTGTRRSKRSKSLQVVRRWLLEASNADRNSSTYMTVNAWFAYWIKITRSRRCVRIQSGITENGISIISGSLSWDIPASESQ